MSIVEFSIRGYGHGYNKVSVYNVFAGMDIQHPYPLPNGYLTCGPFEFNIFILKSYFSIFIHDMLFGAEIII
jgi:hypothetical protein